MRKLTIYQVFQLLITGLGASYILYLGFSYKDENLAIFAATIPMATLLFFSMFKMIRTAISKSKT